MSESSPPLEPASEPTRRRWWQRRRQRDGVSKKESTPFTFTDPGCRSEVRLGILIVLAAVFLWLWLGPANSALLYLCGVPLLVVGIPLQAWQARHASRPGYPLKMGVILALGGAFMSVDSLYREYVDGPLGVQPMGPLLLLPGLWIIAFYFYARRPAKAAAASAVAHSAEGK